MHKAFFESTTEVFNFHLSEETSEWLIHEKFWDQVNTMCNTNFSHYEDDLSDLNTSRVIVNLLCEKIRILDCSIQNEILFVHAWENGLPVYIKVEKSKLSLDLSFIIEYFSKAILKKLIIQCYL